MEGHNFRFDGGEYLTNMGATWFVSYCWWCYVDNEHTNWQKVGSLPTRRNLFYKTGKYHVYWLQQIVNMSARRLSTNKIGITGEETICMAKMLLELRANQS